MASSPKCSVRIPPPLREQLAVVASAEGRSFSAVVVSILGRGVVERAREQEQVNAMIAALDPPSREAA